MNHDAAELSWTRVREAFSELEPLGAEARWARLQPLDSEVRAEVESLLAASEDHPEFLPLPQDRPASLGPYRLRKEIGRGGMGAVYLAERSDGEFHKQVAIKLIHGRMLAPEAARRFIAERQILARLEHANIVRLLDGGVSGGHRYFVMEYAQGGSVVAHCQARNLGVRQRLEIFARICDAIQYAHRQLVIHRDLKADNIVVTADGAPKVLDFGIAQLCLPDSDVNPLTGARVLSYSCASPEQVRGEALTASTDIYSLGVLLYEMLTGENPQAPPGSRQEDAFRRIVEEDPPALRVSPELNAIFQKATAKQARDRYSAVAELGAEVERVLRGEPVRALAGHRWYVLRKFAQRHRTALAAATIGAVSLAGAAVFFARQAGIEARRFETARRFANEVIAQLETQRSEADGPILTRAKLVEKALHYLETISAESGGDARIQSEVASAYVSLARVQAGGIQNAGQRAAAIESIQRGEALLSSALDRKPDDHATIEAGLRLNVEAVLMDVANFNFTAAAEHLRKTEEFLHRLQSIAPREFSTRRWEAEVIVTRGVLMGRSDVQAAMDLYKKSLDLYGQLQHDQPENRQVTARAIVARTRLAEAAVSNGDAEEAYKQASIVAEYYERERAERPHDSSVQLALSGAWVTMARAELARSRWAEALTVSRRALTLRQEIFDADKAASGVRERVAEAGRLVATSLLRLGRLEESAAQARDTLGMLAELAERQALSPVWVILRADAYSVLAQGANARGDQSEMCREGRLALADYEWVLTRQPGRQPPRRAAEAMRSLIVGCEAQPN